MVLADPRDDLAPHRTVMRAGRQQVLALLRQFRPTLFEPRVRYKNDSLLQLDLYPRFKVPPDVTARMPFFITAKEMQALAPAKTMQADAGLTKTTFALQFDDVHRQWTRTSQGTHALWEFGGGTVYLDIEIAVYVAAGFRPRKAAEPGYDPEQEKIFTIIMEHELLHVADEIDLIRNFLPGKVRQDSQVAFLLLRWRSLRDRDFSHWIRNRNREGRTGLEQWIFNDWANEHNRRAAARDSGAAWQRFRLRIDRLMQGQPDPGPL